MQSSFSTGYFSPYLRLTALATAPKELESPSPTKVVYRNLRVSVNRLLKPYRFCQEPSMLIGIDDSVELPETLLHDYTFVPSNHPPNTRSSGIGLFFKYSLSVVRNYLSFDESIVIELK